MKAGYLGLVVLLFSAAGSAQPRLVPQKINLSGGKSITLNLPTDLEIIPAAEGLKRVRFFAKAPDGRIFVTDLYNLTDNKRGAVYILDGWDANTGKFRSVIPYMTGLRNPNSVQFHTDASGQAWLYIAETHQLTRRRFTSGETRPSDLKPQVVATFPDYGLDYKYGGWHLTRTIAFSPAGKLYVSVGSSCNSCVEKERVRASIIEMNPDGSDLELLYGGGDGVDPVRFWQLNHQRADTHILQRVVTSRLQESLKAPSPRRARPRVAKPPLLPLLPFVAAAIFALGMTAAARALRTRLVRT